MSDKCMNKSTMEMYKVRLEQLLGSEGVCFLNTLPGRVIIWSAVKPVHLKDNIVLIP